jgi:hypothetical protein
MRNLLIGLVTTVVVAVTAGAARADYGFTFTSEDTVSPGTVGEMVYFYATLTNTGDQPDTFDVWGELTDFPADWVAQFCDTIACYIIMDQPNPRQYWLDPGEDYPFEIKILPLSNGQGWITMFAQSYGNPALINSIQFHVGCPLDVHLTQMDVVPGLGAVSLGWRVGGGDVAGFHVHRATGGGPYDCVTGEMVRPDPSGGAAFSDTGLRNGRRYSYLIEAVTVSGDSEFLGPFSAVPGQSLSWGVLKAAYR